MFDLHWVDDGDRFDDGIQSLDLLFRMMGNHFETLNVQDRYLQLPSGWRGGIGGLVYDRVTCVV